MVSDPVGPFSPDAFLEATFFSNFPLTSLLLGRLPSGAPSSPVP